MTTPPGRPTSTASTDLGRLRIDRNREPGRSPRRWLLIGAPILLLVIVALALQARSGGLGGAKIETTATVLRPAPGAGGSDVLTANGYVQARRNAAVSAEVQGRLQDLFVQEGSRVKKGQVLARLANEDLRARVARAESEIGVRQAFVEEARAERNDAENELQRQQALLERRLGTQSEFDAAQARRDVNAARISTATEQLTAANAELRVARAELAKTEIRAPFDGTVLQKNAEIGEMVSPVSMGGSGSRGAIVTIASLDSLDVEVDVNESYIGRLRLGQPARVTTDAYPDTAFAARVRQIVPTSDRQKATVLVKAEILVPDARLLPDMGAKVTFLAAGTGTAATTARAYPRLSDQALQQEGGTRFVWLVRPDNTVERRVVTVGANAGGSVEITAGLNGGEVVVVRASKALRDGAKVSRPGNN